MSHQSTVPTLDQAQATVTALGCLVIEFPGLPAPYITIHTSSSRLDLQLETPAAFECWRAALSVPTAAVTLHAYSDAVWLAADARYEGVTVHLSGFGVPLTVEQARESQPTPGQLAEQRHQMADVDADSTCPLPEVAAAVAR